LQSDLLRRELDKKERELLHLKSEVDSMIELDREKQRNFEDKRHKQSLFTDKL
jgi:hypothetical protein